MNPYETQPQGEPVNFCVRRMPPEPSPDFDEMNRILSGSEEDALNLAQMRYEEEELIFEEAKDRIEAAARALLAAQTTFRQKTLDMCRAGG